VEECGPCPVFASFTLAFALQLRKNHAKTSVRVRETSDRLRKTSVRVQYTYYQNTYTLQNPHKHTHYKPHKYTHTHILQNNIKTPQYKLKQTQCKIYPNTVQDIPNIMILVCVTVTELMRKYFRDRTTNHQSFNPQPSHYAGNATPAPVIISIERTTQLRVLQQFLSEEILLQAEA
jgi:hypothetical protein